MNPKYVMVGVGSAVFAAGLTYWVVSPVRSGARAVPMARMSPVPNAAPLVISTAGPDSLAMPVTPTPVVVSAKPSPMGAPITPAAEVPKRVEEPVAAAAEVKQPEAKPVETALAEPPPVSSTPPPPTRVALSPPKEIDRPAEQAVIRDHTIRAPNTVTIAQGTYVTVRLGETLSVQKNLTGDTFFATLDVPLIADGFVLAEKGARVEGKIVEVDKAGRAAGASRISLELTQVNTSDGQRLHLQTSTYTKDGADRNRKNDAGKIAGGAVLGAIIGAAAGGGKGAVVGAGAGGAAGTGAVLLSGGRNITIPVETKILFQLEKPITITERVVQ